jgi:predicted PurR-regulated permease PerM
MFAICAMAVAIALVYILRTVSIPLFIAFFISYAFQPAVNKLSEKIGRTLSVLAMMLLLAIVGLLLLLFLIPVVFDVASTFADSIPSLMDRAREYLTPVLRNRFGIELPASLSEAGDWLKARMGDGKESDLKTAGAVVQWAFSGTLGVISIAMIMILIPFFSFYFMRDYSKIVGWFARLVPPRHLDHVSSLFRDIDNALSHFIRGQLTVCTIMAALYGVALTAFGVDKGAGIGVLTGVLNFVPYVGLTTGLALSFSLSLLNFQGWLPVLGCAITYTALPLLDNFFITPRILGRSVGMNPVIIVIALLVGGQLLGLVGLLVAVPAAAIVRVLGRAAIDSYLKSHIYQG